MASPGLGVRSRLSGQVCFISKQSVSAAFKQRREQASFSSEQAGTERWARGAPGALGPQGPLHELLQLVVMMSAGSRLRGLRRRRLRRPRLRHS